MTPVDINSHLLGHSHNCPDRTGNQTTTRMRFPAGSLAYRENYSSCPILCGGRRTLPGNGRRVVAACSANGSRNIAPSVPSERGASEYSSRPCYLPVSYTHLRAHET